MTKNKIRVLATNSFRMRLFMLKNLPLGFFVGLKVLKIDQHKAEVSVPYKYLNKNPFQSVYFAVLAMAAELSTGILAMASIYDAKVPVSMLVYDMNAEFTKKATSKIIFKCEQGEEISKAVAESLADGEGKIVTVKSVGRNNDGVQVAEFNFTWTFKPKSI